MHRRWLVLLLLGSALTEECPGGYVSESGACAEHCKIRSGMYREQKEELSDVRALIKPRICTALTSCDVSTDFIFANPKKDNENHMTISNRVCLPKTVCNTAYEYTKSTGHLGLQNDNIAFETGSDNTCAPYSICDPATHFISTAGTVTQDRNCTLKTICKSLSEYQVHAAVDATSNTPVGVNTICNARSVCPLQFGILQIGNSTSDNRCEECPAGTQYNSGSFCSPCSTEVEYSSTAGSLVCTPCQQCPATTDYPLNSIINSCTAISQTVCADCPSTWKLDVVSRRCTPCKSGHFMEVGGSVAIHSLTNTICQACEPNTYCVGWTGYEICPNMVGIRRDGQLQIIPSSDTASSRASECVCHAAGGFYGEGSSLRGCQPCPNGTFAPVGKLSCTACPLGEFASQSSYLDSLNCDPNDNVVRVKAPGGLDARDTTMNLQCDPIVAGAVACTPCPNQLTTRTIGSTTIAQCSNCPAGQYSAAGGCSNCTTSCESGSHLVGECTDTTTPTCHVCHSLNGCTGAGVYQGNCPGPDPFDPLNSCGNCGTLKSYTERRKLRLSTTPYTPQPKPLDNSHYIDGLNNQCAWACDPGFYSLVSSDRQCTKCHSMRLADGTLNHTTCPIENIFHACSAEQDASCDQPCTNHTKPLVSAVWLDQEPRCQWACKDGLKEWVSAIGIRFCRAKFNV